VLLGVLYESYVHPLTDPRRAAVGGGRRAADAAGCSTWT
jgi:hypothetical protein